MSVADQTPFKKVLLFLTTFVSIGTVHGAPATFTYQGRIVNANGTPLEYAAVSFEFTITTPDGSCILYREIKDGVDMRNSKGVFDTPIGAGTKKFPASPTFNLLAAFANSGLLSCEGGGTYTPVADDVRRLRVQFFDGSGWKLITPDNTIRSVPFAGYAQTAATANKLGTNVITDFQLKNDIPVCTGGEVLTSTALGVLACTPNGAGGGGSVTSVGTGTGLTGGPITSTGTISIAAGGVSATELGSNAVTTVKVLDGNITGAKLENVVGLTAGAYGSATSIPAITVDAKGRVTAVSTNAITGLLPAASGASGKYLKSDGTNWAGSDVKFSDIKNGVGTSAFNTGSCAANQTVKWSSLTDMFECQNIGSLNAAAITAGTMATAILGTGTADNTTFLRGDGTWATPAGTGDFKADGTVAMTGVFRAVSGNSTTPSITFASDTGTGFYSVAVNTVGFISGGAERYRLSAGSIASTLNSAAHISMGGISATSPPFTFVNDTDTGMYRSGTNAVALTAGGVRGFEVNTAASAVNYVTVTPSATMANPVISAEGSDANIGLTFLPKGSGNSTFSSGKVGIGTSTPQSSLQVTGYTQLDTVTSAPPSTDCDAAAEYGRMKVDTTSGSPKLYVCAADGWIAFQPAGANTCPAGWVRVGDAGKKNSFCIEDNERTAADYQTARNTCQALNDDQYGRAHLCSADQWQTACVHGSGISDMTNGWEWLNYLPDDPEGITVGNGSCSTWQDDPLATANAYRCCM